MKIGDYVRTKEGLIAKYIGIDKEYKWHLFDGNIQWFYEYYRQEIDFEDWEEFIEEDVVKSSPNITDLIKIGDILSFKDNSICRVIDITDNGYYLLKNYGEEQFYERKEWIEDATSILTKEQFESIEYKIGENNEKETY